MSLKGHLQVCTRNINLSQGVPRGIPHRDKIPWVQSIKQNDARPPDPELSQPLHVLWRQRNGDGDSGAAAACSVEHMRFQAARCELRRQKRQGGSLAHWQQIKVISQNYSEDQNKKQAKPEILPSLPMPLTRVFF